jgi:hypothetical protein
MDKPIRLRLGDFTACAFALAKEHERALAWSNSRGVTNFIVRTDADRKHALAILYYMEAAPAFWGDDAELVERSAIRRTAASWRKKLGVGPHDEVPVPYTANRMSINAPTEDELRREAAEGNA